VSIGSGVPSAWGVQEDLICQLARQEAVDPDDPFAWYVERFNRESTYDDLLAALAHTQAERQALLRGYFEPTAEEREAGRKQPTGAHRAIARLVAAGRVRIILTTNFDRLTETALRDEGVEPNVVANSSDIAGMNPLHAQRCLVVHLHGDYLNPSGMLNTAEELGTYPEPLNDLLDKILPDYGLIIVGWSATWDTALRAAISRNPNRFYATYWVDPNPLGKVAQDLLALRNARSVSADAETFLGQIADGCDAIADTGRRHPLTASLAVAGAKRALAGAHRAIPLHDTIRAELERLRGVDVLQPTNVHVDIGNHAARLARLEAALEVPLALVATTAHWGNASTDDWWFNDITRFAKRPRVSGSTVLINLIQAPATYLLYAAGIAAAAAGRNDLLARLLIEPVTTGSRDEQVPISTELPAHHVLGLTRAHRHIHRQLHPLIGGYLGLGEAAFVEASERFEYLRLVHATFLGLEDRGANDGPVHERKVKDLEERLAGQPAGQEATELQEQLDTAQTEAREARTDRARFARLGVPHIRAVERGHDNVPAPAAQLAAEISREGNDHPVISAGLCGGDPDQMIWTMIAVNDAFHRFAEEASWSSLGPTGGVLPSGTFCPDEIGRWATADA
jgi:hypothetical protein